MKITATNEITIWDMFLKDSETHYPFDEHSIAERVSDLIEDRYYFKIVENGATGLRLQSAFASDLRRIRVEVHNGGRPIEYHPSGERPNTVAQAKSSVPKWIREILDAVDSGAICLDEQD